MPKVKGKDIVLYVDTDPFAATPTGTPVWTKVAAQRGFSLEKTSDNFEITSKDSGVNREYEYLYNTSTLSLDGLYVPDDEALAALEKAQDTQQKIKVQRWVNGAAVKEADALISTHTIEGPYDDSGTYSLELQISGGWTDVA